MENQIEKFMMNNDLYDVRLSHSGKWMYFDKTSKMWVVRQRKYRARNTTIIIETHNLTLALIRLGEQSND